MKDVIKTKAKKRNVKSPPPRPIADRICACGCENEFQPNRRDQVYLDKDHANYGYNHGERKVNNASKNLVIKVLSKNDRILEKYFYQFNDEEAICLYDIIVAEGFNLDVVAGQGKFEGKDFFYFIKYGLSFTLKNELKAIKIWKL